MSRKHIPIIRERDFEVLDDPVIDNFLKQIPRSSWIKFAQVLMIGFDESESVRLRTILRQYVSWKKSKAGLAPKNKLSNVFKGSSFKRKAKS